MVGPHLPLDLPAACSASCGRSQGLTLDLDVEQGGDDPDGQVVAMDDLVVVPSLSRYRNALSRVPCGP